MTDPDLEEVHAAESQPASRPTARGRVRRAGPAILIAVLLLAVGASWALASPIGASPDDDFHLGSIWCSATAPDDVCVGGEKDVPGTRLAQIPVRVAREATVCFAGDPTQSAACQPQPQQDGELARTRINDGAYPSGYYALMGMLASSQGEESVLAMRMLTWIASIAIVAASIALLPQRRRPSFVVGFAVASVPLGLFVYASTNPSAFAIAGTFASATAMAGAWWAPSRRRQVVALTVAVLGAFMALSARPDAPVFLVASLVAVGALCWPATREDRVPLAVSIGIAVVSVPFYLSASAADLAGGMEAEELERPINAVLFNNLTELPFLWFGSLGIDKLGWVDTPMPWLVPIAVVGVFSALLFSGLAARTRSKTMALIVLASTMTIVPLFVLIGGRNLVGENVQPRYLLPVLPMLLAVALIGRTGSVTAEMTTAQVAVAWLALGLANSVALHANLRRYTTGIDVIGLDLNDSIEWWWGKGPSPLVVWGIGSVAFLALTGMLLRLHRTSACRPDGVRVLGRAPDARPAHD